MGKNLLILGAGQYGYVAKEVAQAMNCFDTIAFLDDSNPSAIGRIEELARFREEYASAFVAIGNANLRCSLLSALQGAGYALERLIHPRAYVSPSATLAEGVIVEGGGIVNALARVEKGAFVCAGAIVNHHATVGECCQIDCGAVVASGAEVPSKSRVGYNEIFVK